MFELIIAMSNDQDDIVIFFFLNVIWNTKWIDVEIITEAYKDRTGAGCNNTKLKFPS